MFEIPNQVLRVHRETNLFIKALVGDDFLKIFLNLCCDERNKTTDGSDSLNETVMVH